MATISDTLETILRLVELNTFLRGFEMIVGAIDKAVETYAQFDAAVVRTQFFLTQFGNSLPTQEIADFARELSLTTGESERAIASVEGYLARFRTEGADIERATRVIVNASQATGVSIEEMAQMIEKARTGHARALWRELGINIRGVEGQLYSLNQVIDIIDQHTGGFSEVFGTTLPGELRKTGAAIEDLVIQFGRLFSPVMMAALGLITEVVRDLADVFRGLADAMGIAIPGMEGAAAAAGVGGGTSDTTDYLRQITFNTGPQGPLARALTGGGSYAEPGSGVGIRDFSVAFRHVR